MGFKCLNTWPWGQRHTVCAIQVYLNTKLHFVFNSGGQKFTGTPILTWNSLGLPFESRVIGKIYGLFMYKKSVLYTQISEKKFRCIFIDFYSLHWCNMTCDKWSRFRSSWGKSIRVEFASKSSSFPNPKSLEWSKET